MRERLYKNKEIRRDKAEKTAQSIYVGDRNKTFAEITGGKTQEDKLITTDSALLESFEVDLMSYVNKQIDELNVKLDVNASKIEAIFKIIFQ